MKVAISDNRPHGKVDLTPSAHQAMSSKRSLFWRVGVGALERKLHLPERISLSYLLDDALR